MDHAIFMGEVEVQNRRISGDLMVGEQCGRGIRSERAGCGKHRVGAEIGKKSAFFHAGGLHAGPGLGKLNAV
jgi:hypothetical protein